jgi:hypothetical protein
VSSNQSSNTGHLTAAIWIDQARVYQNHAVEVNLSFTNEGATPANALSVEFRAPGLKQTGPCWSKGYPACAPNTSVPAGLPATIKPGESILRHAALTPPEDGHFGLLVIYHWSEAPAASEISLKGEKAPAPAGRPPQEYVSAVALEPLDVTSRTDEFLAWVASWLALPLIVGIGGAIWQLWAADREKEFEVWKEQLGKLFDYIPRYYLPIARASYNLWDAVADLKAAATAAKPEKRRRVFYYFIAYWMRMRALREKAGWFLSTKAGERLLQAIWSPLLTEFDRLNLQRIEEISDILGKPVSYPRFCKEFVAAPAPVAGAAPPAVPPPGLNVATFTDAETEMLGWVEAPAPDDSFERCLSLMSMQRAVLAFEWDRPFYGYWYKDRPRIDVAEFKGYLEKLPQPSAADARLNNKINQLKKVAETYAKSVKKYSTG